MKFTSFTITALSAAACVAAYPLSNETAFLNCRSEPSTSGKLVKKYVTGDDIQIQCQVSSQRISDYAIWDKTQDGCYVSDYYVATGKRGYVTKNCLYNGKFPGPIVDDYRYKDKCDEVDPWNYYICQCVSFVAQRINERQGIYFTNRYKGQHWGNANEWPSAARNSPNVTINNKPKKGCIAQHSRSKLGHVAYVHSVNHRNKSIVIEQYNVIPHHYNTLTVPWSDFDYFIHLDKNDRPDCYHDKNHNDRKGLAELDDLEDDAE